MDKPIKTNRVGRYLKEKREKAELSLREASKLAGVSHTHIMEIEDGKKSPTFDKVMNILQAYHADAQEFLQETGYWPVNVEPANLGKLRKIPVISWVIAGRWSGATDPFQPGDAEEWTESDAKGPHVFALRVKGDSMVPEFNEGDIVVVSPHVRAVSGDYVVVKNDEEEVTLKQLKKYGTKRILHPLNPKYEDIELSDKRQFRIVGKIVEKKKRY
jgi:SOS-response transcriptional repressor LexA